jgi:hypothetical protein
MEDMRMHVHSWRMDKPETLEDVEVAICRIRGHLQEPSLSGIESEAARDAMDFVAGAAYVSFCSEKALRYGVEHRIEVLGEAPRHVSQSFQESYPELPQSGVDLRNSGMSRSIGISVMPDAQSSKIWVGCESAALFSQLSPHSPEVDGGFLFLVAAYALRLAGNRMEKSST